ncbi:MAG: hypothetical protein ACFWTY_06240 [Shouchella clausii]
MKKFLLTLVIVLAFTGFQSLPNVTPIQPHDKTDIAS